MRAILCLKMVVDILDNFCCSQKWLSTYFVKIRLESDYFRDSVVLGWLTTEKSIDLCQTKAPFSVDLHYFFLYKVCCLIFTLCLCNDDGQLSRKTINFVCTAGWWVKQAPNYVAFEFSKSSH